MLSVEIIEVIRRSAQGMTQPFICRGDNGRVYFVKGKGAGRRSLVCEWISGYLALELGIPIAPFSLVSIPEELLDANYLLDLTDLGVGYAFGSQECTLNELVYSRVNQVPQQIQQAVLAFDWWIHNEDRTLSANGGNPNLFWNESDEQLVVIDHNQAFDLSFDPLNFINYHVFHTQWTAVIQCPKLQAKLILKMQQALNQWDNWIESIPEAWWYLDEELTVSAKIDKEQMFQILNRVNKNEFWSLP
jgi:hypothetical protein